MLRVPKPRCEFNAHLSLPQQEYLHELVEAGIEDAQVTYKQLQDEIPSGGTTGDDAEEYSNLLATSAERLHAYEAIMAMLQEE